MAIDIIGQVVETPAVIDESGEVTTPAVMADGFHVNTIGETIDKADAYIVEQPNTPSQLFAGRAASEHTFYRFPDEAGFREFVPEPEEASE